MTFKHLLALGALTATFAVSGQIREYEFNGFQSSNPDMQWAAVRQLPLRKANFSDSRIELSLDRTFRLSITSKKNLPNGGMVYLCKDQRMNDVTITLIANERMFLYTGNERYQVTFRHPVVASVRNSYAEAD